MSRVLISVFLTLNVIACPLRCQGCFAGAVPSEASEPGCACCAPTEPRGGPGSSDLAGENELPLDDDCSCQDCICEGAVVSAKEGGTLSDGQLVCCWTDHHGSLTADDPASMALTRRAADLSPLPILSGRDARIAYQSFLN